LGTGLGECRLLSLVGTLVFDRCGHREFAMPCGGSASRSIRRGRTRAVRRCGTAHDGGRGRLRIGRSSTRTGQGRSCTRGIRPSPMLLRQKVFLSIGWTGAGCRARCGAPAGQAGGARGPRWPSVTLPANSSERGCAASTQPIIQRLNTSTAIAILWNLTWNDMSAFRVAPAGLFAVPDLGDGQHGRRRTGSDLVRSLHGRASDLRLRPSSPVR